MPVPTLARKQDYQSPDTAFADVLERHTWWDGGAMRQICSFCNDFPWDKLPYEEDRALPHKESLEALIQSAEKCPLCFLITLGVSCSLSDPVGMITDRFLDLAGRMVKARCARSNYVGSGMVAKESGAMIYSPDDIFLPLFSQPNMQDPSKVVSDPRAVRPWVFGNWWKSVFVHREPQLIGLGVRLATRSDIESAVGNEAGRVTMHGSYIRIRCDDNAAMSRTIPGRLQTNDQDSEIAFGRLKDRLVGCDKHHSCVSSEGATPLPSRVLNVRPGRDPNVICLQESHGQTGRYLALSHCWGKSHRITTTTATLAAHKRGISLARLPQTFKDAVHITRRLNIQYLWIDSLCIIQNNAADWEAEASRMGGVYSRAYLTVSALSSLDDESGCFTIDDDRSPLPLAGVSCDSRSTGRPCFERPSPMVVIPPMKDAFGIQQAYNRYLNFALGPLSELYGPAMSSTYQDEPPTHRVSARDAAGNAVGGKAIFDHSATTPCYALFLDKGHALILRPVRGSGNVFTRIGVVQFYGSAHFAPTAATAPVRALTPTPGEGPLPGRRSLLGFRKEKRRESSQVEAAPATGIQDCSRKAVVCVVTVM